MKCPECKAKLKVYCVRPVDDKVSRHYTCKCGFTARTIEQFVPANQDFGRRHWRVDRAGVVRWKTPRQSSNSL